MTDNKFKAKISVVFKQNYFKPTVISDYFSPNIFHMTHDWQTCKIDGCCNCCYETLPDVDPALVLLHLIEFVNGVLANKATDEANERVKITRKLLAGTRMITFELADYCRVFFDINHVDSTKLNNVSVDNETTTSNN